MMGVNDVCEMPIIDNVNQCSLVCFQAMIAKCSIDNVVSLYNSVVYVMGPRGCCQRAMLSRILLGCTPA